MQFSTRAAPDRVAGPARVCCAMAPRIASPASLAGVLHCRRRKCVPVTARRASVAMSSEDVDVAGPTDTTRLPAAAPLGRRAALAALSLAAAPGLVGGPGWRFPAAAASAPTEAAVRGAAAAALARLVPISKAPVLLRLVFHDAGTYDAARGDGGANGSVRFELDRPESVGLKRGIKVLDTVRDSLIGTPAVSLSYADLVALAGAHAVAITGGPVIVVRLGRVDATGPDPPGRLPAESVTAPELLATFARGGYSTRETVALLGAHTLGGKGFGSPLSFDNAYYSTLVANPWKDGTEMSKHIGLASDRALLGDAACMRIVAGYAADGDAFRRDFAAAFTKLTAAGATWAA